MSSSISGDVGVGQDFVGRDEQNNRLSVNISERNRDEVERYARMVDDHEAALYGDRRSDFPGLKIILMDVLKRLEHLERDLQALRAEVKNRPVFRSEITPLQIWAMFGALLFISLGVMYVVAKLAGAL